MTDHQTSKLSVIGSSQTDSQFSGMPNKRFLGSNNIYYLVTSFLFYSTLVVVVGWSQGWSSERETKISEAMQ